MKLFLGNTVGQLFSDYGAYVIGTFEGIVSIVLLIAIISYAGKALKMCKGCNKEFLFAIGGISATLLMAGAVFFHLVTPLGVVVPIGDPSLGQTDGGSLFKAATSILILGLVLFAINGKALADKYNCACLKKIFK